MSKLQPRTTSRLVIPPLDDGVEVRVLEIPLGGNRSPVSISDWSLPPLRIPLDEASTYLVAFRDRLGRSAERFVRAHGPVRDHEILPGAMVHTDDLSGMLSVEGGTLPNGDDAAIAVAALLVDVREITNGEYLDFMRAEERSAPKHWPPPAEREAADFLGKPITGISCDEAEQYAASVGKRLPTASEWRWLASGKDNRSFVWADPGLNPEALANVAQRTDIGGRRSLDPGDRLEFDRVSYMENADVCGSNPGDRSWCGVMDLQGNVCEWTASSKFESTSGAVMHASRAVMGGWFRGPLADVRPAKYPFAADSDYATGFRCVRTIIEGS